jgi:hypothetical protein
MLASFGLLSVFWSMLFFFLFVAWITLVIRVYIDIFRSDDLGGGAKVLWIILVMALPLLGVFLYMILRGQQLNEHAQADMAVRGAAMNTSVPRSGADELTKLVALRDQGVLTPAEFDAAKAKALG